MQSSQNHSFHSQFKIFILILGILLLAANLRAPITGIAPVLDQIIAEFQLSSMQAGLLTTLPLLGFALASPLAAKLAKRFGLELSLFIAVVLITIGTLARLLDIKSVLFSATAVIGVGIAIGNVLIPSLIKRDFPTKVAAMTSAYVLAMGVTGGGFSALVLPISAWLDIGWQLTLALFAVISILTIVVWLPQLRYKTKPETLVHNPSDKSRIWHFPLAWQVTFFLGCNSLFTYIIVGWLPSILTESGYSAENAGAIHGLFLIATAVPGLMLAPALARLKDQRIPAVAFGCLAGCSSLGIYFYPPLALFWTLLMGFTSGACFILGLSFIGLRSNNAMQAASLSSMAQCIGYTLAATGPMIAGFLHSSTQSWLGAILICAAANFTGAILGLGAGRNITISILQTKAHK